VLGQRDEFAFTTTLMQANAGTFIRGDRRYIPA
jgi:hypothetical protein